MQIGFIGLGKMGSRMAQKLLLDGHEVVVWNRSEEAISNFKFQISRPEDDQPLAENLIVAKTIKNLVSNLKPPRTVWLMLPAGDATESILQEVTKYLEQGDIIVDGGNAFYKDTERRSKALHAKGIGFLGIGVSGGVKAYDIGYPLMVGGERSAYDHISPLLDSLGKPNGGHAYFGTGGAGHFVKMVHNGIEYGMMQAIGEGFGVVEKSPYDIDLGEAAKLWQKNTIISGFLMDCAVSALSKDKKLSEIQGVIDATGEAEWTVNQAREEGVPIENIEQSLTFRQRSKNDPLVSNSFAAKMVAALRHEFGGHDVKKK